MGWKLAGIAVLAVVALTLLAGCNMAGGGSAVIIGSISLDPDSTDVGGGTEYHVLVYDASDTIAPGTPSTVNGLIPVAHLDSTFPGSMGDWFWTTNYILTDVPEGLYFIFVWIDLDDSSDFDNNYDAYGFYDADATNAGYAMRSEPLSPNVVVPKIGVIDIDVLCGFPPT